MIKDGKWHICLGESGAYKLHNGDAAIEEIVIHVEPFVKVDLLLTLKGEDLSCRVAVYVHENAELNILYKGECRSLICEEEVEIEKDGLLKSGYLSLTATKVQRQVHCRLLEEGADAHMISATLAKDNVNYAMTCTHETRYTSSKMEHYCICFENGKYTMNAGGKIVKYASGSKSHQSTRVLTLGEKERVSVTPLLLIDENDVEASHACSIGEMNEDHLYYLQTRGLDKQQALGLLTLSYVTPILQLFEEGSELYKEVMKEIEDKVGLSC